MGQEGQFPAWIVPLAFYGAIVLGLMGLLLGLCSWLGERKPSSEKLRPYECGILPTGSARLAYPLPFYLVAILFLIFDVEAVYVLSWAVVARRLGKPGWILMFLFLGILILGLGYVWRRGGLDWGTSRSNGPGEPRSPY